MPTHTLITEKKKKKKEAAGVADAHFVFALPNASSTANEISLEQDEWVVTQSSAQSKRFDEERKKKKKDRNGTKGSIPSKRYQSLAVVRRSLLSPQATCGSVWPLQGGPRKNNSKSKSTGKKNICGRGKRRKKKMQNTSHHGAQMRWAAVKTVAGRHLGRDACQAPRCRMSRKTRPTRASTTTRPGRPPKPSVAPPAAPHYLGCLKETCSGRPA